MLKPAKLTLAFILVFRVAVSSVDYSRGSLPTIDASLAACAARASSIEVEPKQVSANDSFKVYGEGFGKIVECDDTGFVGEESEGAVFEPRENISIELRQDSQRWELSTVDADEDLAFDEEFQFPAEVAPGQATVTANKGNQGAVKATISVVKTVTSGSLAEPRDGGLPPPPSAYEVKPNGDIVFGGDAILGEGCDTVAVSSSEDFPSLTEREFQDVVATQCAEPNSSAPGGETNLSALPDTGGLPLGVAATGLGAGLVAGGLLFKRRLS